MNVKPQPTLHPIDSWRERAACLGKAPLFDATIDDGMDDPNRETRIQRAERFEQAKAICRTCTVGAECDADWELGRDEGFRNGKILPSISRPNPNAHKGLGHYSDAPCGTAAAYTAHKRRGEEACERCLVAAAEATQRRAKRRRAS